MNALFRRVSAKWITHHSLKRGRAPLPELAGAAAALPYLGFKLAPHAVGGALGGRLHRVGVEHLSLHREPRLKPHRLGGGPCSCKFWGSGAPLWPQGGGGGAGSRSLIDASVTGVSAYFFALMEMFMGG